MGGGVPMHFQNNIQAIYFYQLFLRMQQNPFVLFIDGYANPYYNLFLTKNLNKILTLF